MCITWFGNQSELSICVECHEAEHKDIVAVQTLNSFGLLYVSEVSDFFVLFLLQNVLRAIHCIQLFLDLLVCLILEKGD